MKRSNRKIYLEFLAANVRRRRVRLGLTQEALAEAAGIDSRFVRRVEAARVHMVLDTLFRLAEALAVRPGTLLRPAARISRRPGRPSAP